MAVKIKQAEIDQLAKFVNEKLSRNQIRLRIGKAYGSWYIWQDIWVGEVEGWRERRTLQGGLTRFELYRYLGAMHWALELYGG